MTEVKVPKIDVVVQVSGPGGCINYEIELIRRAMEAAGIEVVIRNSHPDPQDVLDTMFERAETIGNMTRVVIQAYHSPWGG
jgi:hypothetical protein